MLSQQAVRLRAYLHFILKRTKTAHSNEYSLVMLPFSEGLQSFPVLVPEEILLHV